jgi:hypothetical protein
LEELSDKYRDSKLKRETDEEEEEWERLRWL